MNAERKYVAVSIKHTEHKWKFGDPCTLWGWKQTEDDKPRCFSDYTVYLSKAERYALGEFTAHGYDPDLCKDDEPVVMCPDFCKRYKRYDTVLVDAGMYFHYCLLCGLPIEPPNEEVV